MLPPAKCDTSRNPQVDLLSGEDINSRSDSQPMTEISLLDPSLDMSHDRKEDNDSQRVSVHDKTPTKTSAQHYISCFEILTALVCYFLYIKLMLYH